MLLSAAADNVRLDLTALDFFRRLGSSLCPTPNTLLTTSCLSYLSACEFAMSSISSYQELKGFLGSEKHPLCNYAYCYWGTHAAGCYEEDGIPSIITDLLLQWRHYPFMTDGRNFDLLEQGHIAAYLGLWLDRLLQGNEWCNHPTSIMKFTPLILACNCGNKDFVKLLLSRHDVAINIQTKVGQTALYAASYNGHATVIELLLLHNDIAINTQTNNGLTALYAAALRSHEAVVKLLLSHHNLAVNTQTRDGWTPLIVSCYNGHEAVVKLLLSHSDITVNTSTKDSWTALYVASYNGYEAVVKQLLSQHDVTVNPQTKKGWTALIAAADNGHEAVVKLLLSHNDIAVNTQTKDGLTALYTAS